MAITLGDARRSLAEYAGKKGKCASSEDVRLFVLEVVQRLLHRGANGNLRKWCFHLSDGCFTAPPDMDVPLKVKINGFPDRMWSKWYEFFDIHSADLRDENFKNGMFEQVNSYYTVYDIPQPGARIAAVSLENESADAHIIVQGEDEQGRDVFTTEKGETIHGEKLPIRRSKPVFSKTTFSKITGIQKTKTKNYARLYWQVHDDGKVLARGLLSEFRPVDISPVYRRFKVPHARSDCPVKVEVLGRVKALDHYHDNDVLPITSLGAMRSMAMTIRAERTNNIQGANFHNQRADQIIENENEYKRTGSEDFDFVHILSPGSNENLQ